MISNNDFALIAALDLDPIKMKLMHTESGEGWSQEQANAIETEYRRFLYVMKAFPHVPTAPTEDVDTFWHYHILDTLKYARDCEQAFGYFVHHYPYLGMAGEEDMERLQQAGRQMRELYETTFGVSYVRPLRTDGALEAADVQTACEAGAGQAANSAWCFGPDDAKAGEMNTAWCFGPDIKAANTRTAWCFGPDIKAAGARTAWCFGPDIKAGSARTAWCFGPDIKAGGARTAWCFGPDIVKAGDVRTAWCFGPDMVKAADVQTACYASPAVAHAA